MSTNPCAYDICALADAHVKLGDVAQQEIDEISDKITDLQTKHNNLLRHIIHIQISIRHLQARAAHIRNQSASVSRLPSDILALIFEECRHLPPTWFGVKRVLPIEVRLSHVTRRWREVAIGIPSLWSSIKYPMLHGEGAILEYIKRSNGCLLDVHLGPRSAYQQYIQTVTTTLIPRVSAFRELIIDTDGRQELNDILALFRDVAAPSLKRFKVTCQDTTTPYPHCPIFAGGAPLLAEVHVDSIPVSFPKLQAVALNVSHSPVTRHSLDRDSFHRIMTSFKSLTTLHVTGSISGLERDFSGSTIELLSLQDLSLHGNIHGNIPFNGSRVSGFFKLISVPNLQILSLVDFNAAAVSSVFKHITESYPTHFQLLHSLQLSGCRIPSDVDLYLLRSTPAISNLSVPIDLRISLMRLLLNSDKQALMLGTSPLWPEMKTMTLFTEVYRSHPDEGNDETGVSPTMSILCDFLAGRSALGRTIDMVRFSGPNSETFTPRLQTELQRLQMLAQTQVVACKPLDPHASNNWAFAGDRQIYEFRQLRTRQAQFLQFQKQYGISISTSPRYIYVNLQNPPPRPIAA